MSCTRRLHKFQTSDSGPAFSISRTSCDAQSCNGRLKKPEPFLLRPCAGAGTTTAPVSRC